MAASDYASVVQQLYISYFGRPADYYGLSSFEAQLAADGAPSDFAKLNASLQSGTNLALNTLVNGFSSAAESTALYGTGSGSSDISAFVNAIYTNVLNRKADPAGLAFWTQAIASGVLSKADASVSITAGALANSTDQGKIDAAVVSNKLAVASSFTGELTTTPQIDGYAGDAAAATARAMLSKVTDTTNLAAFEATIESTINALTLVTDVKTTLTTGQDNLTGTVANDTYLAPVTLSSGIYADSLNSDDVIDGGAGANTLSATILGFHETPTLKNIQTVQIGFNQAGTLDLLHATGVESVLVEYGGSGTVANLGDIATLAVRAQSGGVTFANSTAKTLALSLDTFGINSSIYFSGAVNLQGDLATTVNLSTNNSTANVLTGTAITTLSVAASGSNAIYINGSALTSLTVTGTGSLTLGDTLSAVTHIDASGNSGGVSIAVGNKAISITGGGGDDSIEFDGVAAGTHVSLGAGNDYVLIDGALADTTAVIDGGTGDNVLALASAADLGTIKTAAQFAATFLDFQTLFVIGDGTVATTADLAIMTGFSSYVVQGNGGKVVLEHLGNGATITVESDMAALTLLTGTTTGDLVNASVSLTMLEGDSYDSDSVAKLSTDAATLTIHSKAIVASGGVNVLMLDGAEANLSTVVIDGIRPLQFTTGALAGHTLNIDASAITRTVTVDASLAVEKVNIEGSSSADTILAGTVGGAIYGGAGGDSITLGAGADTIVYKAASDSAYSDQANLPLLDTGLDTITHFVSGTDKIDLTALALSPTSVIVAKTAADTGSLTALAATADFYNDATGTARSVVEVVVGANTYLFVDANQDHKFDSSTDLVIKLAGVASVAIGDLVFA